jgi:hypothetical protein
VIPFSCNGAVDIEQPRSPPFTNNSTMADVKPDIKNEPITLILKDVSRPIDLCGVDRLVARYRAVQRASHFFGPGGSPNLCHCVRLALVLLPWPTCNLFICVLCRLSASS